MGTYEMKRIVELENGWRNMEECAGRVRWYCCLEKVWRE